MHRRFALRDVVADVRRQVFPFLADIFGPRLRRWRPVVFRLGFLVSLCVLTVRVVRLCFRLVVAVIVQRVAAFQLVEGSPERVIEIGALVIGRRVFAFGLRRWRVILWRLVFRALVSRRNGRVGDRAVRPA
jgi:hypothetical protein